MSAAGGRYLVRTYLSFYSDGWGAKYYLATRLTFATLIPTQYTRFDRRFTTNESCADSVRRKTYFN